MQIIPPLAANANVPHMFETPYDMIINGQVYDKATMKPKPYHFANITNFLPECQLFDECVNRIGEKACLPDKGVDYKNIMQDTKDSNIFYMLYFVPGDTATIRLSKVQKHDNTYTVLNTAAYGSPYGTTNVADAYKFLAQTKDYILLSEAHRASSSGRNDIRNIVVRRVSKQDLSSVYVIDYANDAHLYYSNSGSTCFACSHYFIKGDDSYVYLYVYYGDAAFIRKYNVLNNTWATLYTFESAYVGPYSIGVSNLIERNGKYYALTGNAEHTSYELQEITIDPQDTVSVRHYSMSHPLWAYSTNGFRTNTDELNQLSPYLIYTLKNIDDQYIGLTVHYNEGWGVDGRHKHALIKQTGGTFTVTDVHALPACFGVLYYNPHVSVVLTTEGFTFYRVNKERDAWEEIRRESGTFNYIAFDSYKRFYTVNTANQVAMYSNVSTYEIDVHFQHTGYQYQGQPIYTWCLVSAKNFLGDYIETELKVTLTGPVRFADGSTEKIIATQGDVVGEEVYICGSGQIGVHAIEVEGWS